MDILKFNSVEEKIITLRGIPVIIDCDVAEIYGVETHVRRGALREFYCKIHAAAPAIFFPMPLEISLS